MVDFDLLLDIPFEAAPNRLFQVLLLAGTVLFAVVAITGRSTITAGAVVLYLLFLPAYVVFRVRTRGGTNVGADGESEDDGE